MKRWIAIILFFMTVIHLAGCQNEPLTQHVSAFYYCVADLNYSMDSTTIRAEYRDTPSDKTLQKMLETYFSGPVAAELRSPFPAGLQLINASIQEKTIYITVNDVLASLSGLNLTLACSCITLTCLDFTNAEQVVISAQGTLLDGQKSITMDKNTLLLLDTVLEGD